MTQPALDLGAAVPSLRFDENQHRYFLDPKGEEIPGVTRALEECGLTDFSMVPRHILEAAQQRGTDVHNALHFLDDGELDQASLTEEMHGFVMAYLRFKNEMKFEPTLVEKFVHSLSHRWAGRLDRVGTLGRKDGGFDLTVVDFKSGMVLPAHAIQLAAYTSGLPESRKYRRMTLELDSNGKYKIHEYEPQAYARDLNVFHSAVNVWHWKNDHGLLKKAA